MEPIEGTFDIIYGRAILHHVEYKTLLKRLYEKNLNSGGFMIFMEQLGSNSLSKFISFYSKIGTHAG